MGTGWDNAADMDTAQRSTLCPKCNTRHTPTQACYVGATPLAPAPVFTVNQGGMIERLIEASHLRDASGKCYFCSSSGADRDGWCRRTRRVEVTDTEVSIEFGE